jgi:Protein of unknown function (DUF1236)
MKHPMTRSRTGHLAATVAVALTCAAPLPAAATSSSVMLRVLAQAEPVTPVQPKIKLTMEQEHIIKEFILKDTTIGKAPGSTAVKIGEPVPAGIELRPFPAAVTAKVPQVKAHAFFVHGEQVVVVNPQDNKVADVIE